jgi:hypothetical protein
VRCSSGSARRTIKKLHGRIIYIFASKGGSKSFTELVKEANLISPFEDSCVKSVMDEIEVYLDSIDDKAL